MINNFKSAVAATLIASAVAVAAPASAAVNVTFLSGAASPVGGYTVINTFVSGAGIVGTGNGFLIKTGTDYQGAAPAAASPGSGSYLSVLGGGTATITFASPVYAFEFDAGSIDSYNSLTATYVGGTYSFNTVGGGNQVSSIDNGVVRIFGNAGEQFTSVTFASNQNSFELDNLAIVAVPEPATWAMLICGFGLVGAAVRRRKSSTTVVYA